MTPPEQIKNRTQYGKHPVDADSREEHDLTNVSKGQLKKAAEQWFLEKTNAPKPFRHAPYLIAYAALLAPIALGIAEAIHIVPDALPFGIHNPDLLTNSLVADVLTTVLAGVGEIGTYIYHGASFTDYELRRKQRKYNS